MEKRRLHIVFSDSAAGDLQKALSQASREDRVTAFPDNLSFGPIAGVDFDTRTEWVRETLGDLSGIYSREAQDVFWRDALSEDLSRVVWLSRRSTWEFAGFLELIWRLGDAPLEVVDLTEFVFPGRVINGRQYPSFLPGSLAMLTSDQILDFDLLDQAEPLTITQRDQYRSAWTTLRTENTDLRVIDDQLNLVSAPITYFDRQLMSGAEERWLKSARIIGQTMATFLDDARYQAGDSFLASRVRALVKAGLLEGAGDLWQMRFSEVRLPPSQA